MSTEREQEVVLLLRSFGADPQLSGYHYVKRAIHMAMEDETTLFHLMPMYEQIAAEYKTTPSRVERAIRHFIERLWYLGDRHDLRKLFVGAESKPRNGSFIAGLVEQLKVFGAIGA